MRSMALTARAARQRGSIILPAAVAILVSLVLLASADIGYVFYLKRELQKAADLSAVAAAQRIEIGAVGPTCGAPVIEAAQDVARRNLVPAGVEGETRTLRCGQWLRTAGAGVAPPAELGDPSAPEEWFFSANANVNAVWVRLDLRAPQLMPLMPISRDLMAHAVAVQDAPVAAFSVGSQLLRFEKNSVLGVVLDQVGVNADVLTVLDGNGLANTMLTPGGLLQALGIPITADMTVADINGVLAARQVQVGDLLQATADVIGQNQFAALGLNALNTIRLAPGAGGLLLRELRVPLGSAANGRGLFAEIIAPAGAVTGALNATLSAGDLVSTLLTVAAFDNRVTRSAHAVGADILALAGVQVSVRVVEPARIGIGGVGTRAYNAQIRTHVDIDTDRMPLLSFLLNLLNTRVHLPLHVDLVGGHGEITALSCQGERRTVDIRVKSSILNACVANLQPSGLFSSLAACEPRVQPAQTLVSLFGAPVLRDNVPPIPGLQDVQTLAFSVAAGDSLPMLQTTNVNALALGNALTSVSSAVTTALSSLFAPAAPTSEVTLNLAHQYLRAATPTGRYNVASVIPLLRDGAKGATGATTLPGLGSWTVRGGVPYRCALGLSTCWGDGDVWLGFHRVITGEERGLVSGLLGTLLGGLLLNDCTGLTSQLLNYNACVAGNLASYLQTNPNRPVTNPNAGLPSQGCKATLLCTLLSGITEGLSPLLNNVGATLSQVLGGVAGVELGRTEVRLLSLGCYNARLVY